MSFKFTIGGLISQNVKPLLFNPIENDQETVNKYSYLGTPVFSNLEIKGGQYLDNDGETVIFDGIRLDTCLLEVSVDKNIIRTPIDGRDGTVKQFINLGDYVINVQGIIIGTTEAVNGGFEVTDTGRVPEEEIRKLNEIFKVPQELEIVSEFLDFFDISTVVIEGGSFGQREGFRDSVYFGFSMLSDRPIELK